MYVREKDESVNSSQLWNGSQIMNLHKINIKAVNRKSV